MRGIAHALPLQRLSELCAHNFKMVRCKHSKGVSVLLGGWRSLCEARVRHALTAEMSETFPSGGSMHASVKLEGIDGRAPQERVEHVA